MVVGCLSGLSLRLVRMPDQTAAGRRLGSTAPHSVPNGFAPERRCRADRRAPPHVLLQLRPGSTRWVGRRVPVCQRHLSPEPRGPHRAHRPAQPPRPHRQVHPDATVPHPAGPSHGGSVSAPNVACRTAAPWRSPTASPIRRSTGLSGAPRGAPSGGGAGCGGGAARSSSSSPISAPKSPTGIRIAATSKSAI